MTVLCDWLHLGVVKGKEQLRMACMHCSLCNCIKAVLFIDPKKESFPHSIVNVDTFEQKTQRTVCLWKVQTKNQGGKC